MKLLSAGILLAAVGGMGCHDARKEMHPSSAAQAAGAGMTGDAGHDAGHDDTAVIEPEKSQAPTRSSWMSTVDSAKAEQARAVLRVELLEEGAGDKIIWDTVRVEKILVNKTRFRFPDQLLIAHYSFSPGLVARESTVYLVPYPLGEGEAEDAQRTQWMVLDGNGALGSTR